MSMKETADHLQLWVKVKRQCALTDAHVQMARELGMNPKRLLQAESPEPEPLARRIENLYLKRFKKPLPDAVVPLRHLLHDTRARERAEAHERRRRKRQAERDHLEAMRISMLTLRRMYGGLGADDELTEPGGLNYRNRRC
jgi:hypothetical protein